MIVSDLFNDPDRRRFAAMPETDPLTEEGGLDEAALVGARLDVMIGSAGLLFDLRGAIGFRLPDIAVLIARDVDRFSWENDDLPDSEFDYLEVLGWYPSTNGTDWELKFWLRSHPDRPVSLSIRARSAEFYVGDVPGYPDRQPSIYDDRAEVVLAGFPRWDAEFTPTAATFLNRYPG